MVTPRLVLVEWEDAYSGNHEWIDVDTIPENVAPLLIKTVGFVVRRDRQRVTLAMSIGSSDDEERDDTCCDLFTIPRVLIRSERVLG